MGGLHRGAPNIFMVHQFMKRNQIDLIKVKRGLQAGKEQVFKKERDLLKCTNNYIHSAQNRIYKNGKYSQTNWRTSDNGSDLTNNFEIQMQDLL